MTRDELVGKIADGTLTVGELLRYRELATPEELDALKVIGERLNVADVFRKVEQLEQARREVDALTVTHNWFALANGDVDLNPR